MRYFVLLLKRGGKVFAHLFLLSAACVPLTLAGDVLRDVEKRSGGLPWYVTAPAVALLLVLALLWLGFVFPAETRVVWRRDELFSPVRRAARAGRA